MPVIHKLVEVFKDPPKSSAEEKEFSEEIWLVQHEAMASSLIRDRIDDNDIAEPQKWKSVGLKGLKPREAIPGDHPGTGHPSDSHPPPPGKLKT